VMRCSTGSAASRSGALLQEVPNARRGAARRRERAALAERAAAQRADARAGEHHLMAWVIAHAAGRRSGVRLAPGFMARAGVPRRAVVPVRSRAGARRVRGTAGATARGASQPGASTASRRIGAMPLTLAMRTAIALLLMTTPAFAGGSDPETGAPHRYGDDRRAPRRRRRSSQPRRARQHGWNLYAPMGFAKLDVEPRCCRGRTAIAPRHDAGTRGLLRTVRRRGHLAWCRCSPRPPS
jgi:hypothetical protein